MFFQSEEIWYKKFEKRALIINQTNIYFRSQ